MQSIANVAEQPHPLQNTRMLNASSLRDEFIT